MRCLVSNYNMNSMTTHNKDFSAVILAFPIYPHDQPYWHKRSLIVCRDPWVVGPLDDKSLIPKNKDNNTSSIVNIAKTHSSLLRVLLSSDYFINIESWSRQHHQSDQFEYDVEEFSFCI